MSENDTVVVVHLSICGGSPRCPSSWTEEGSIVRAWSRDVTTRCHRTCIEITHSHGIVPCRMATPDEIAILERAEADGRDPRPWELWRGRPAPRAPSYR